MKKRFYQWGAIFLVLIMMFTNLPLAMADGDLVYHTDPELAAAQIRQAMVERQERFTVGYVIEGKKPETEEDLYEIAIGTLREKALAETEKGTEGDALRFCFSEMGISATVLSSENQSQVKMEITYETDYYTNAVQEAQLTAAVDALMKEFAFTEQTTEKEKVDAIYGWICKNVQYDKIHADTFLEKYSAYDAMVLKTAVCEGYAVLFYRLAKEAGLDARVITGLSNNQPHAWNIVRLDGIYYFLDATWDSMRETEHYQYYLKGIADFDEHAVEARYATAEFLARYPISPSNYGEHQHQFDHACDAECNTCKAVRTVTHSYGEYVYNDDATTVADGTKTRACSVCGATETVTAEGTKIANPFADVKADKFYAESVLWAVEKGITNGLTDTTFGPGKTCTRGQIVAFLWRAAGSPEPKSTTNPFTDVKEGKFYYKAVLWAVENGITNGTSATTFGPNNPCTRGQVVTFLWRAKGGEKVSASNPFTDVNKGFFVDAVAWAVKNDITSGTSKTEFSPANDCTRGQIVTFLYRAYK